MANPHAIAEQRERLKRLVDLDLAWLTQTQQRQVRIVEALIRGETGKEIAKQMEIGPSAISNIRSKLASNGLDAFLQKWERAVAGAKSDSMRLPGTPGPRGINSIKEWIENESADEECVVEVARLLIAPGANIAVFAVRDRSIKSQEGKPRAQSFCKTFRTIFEKPALKDVHWSKLSFFDTRVSQLLAWVSKRSRDLETLCGEFKWNEDLADDPMPLLRENFGSDYELFILAQGDAAESVVQRWCEIGEARREGISLGNIARVPIAADFFARLTSTIYRLRERWSGPGLLPSLSVIHGWAKELMQSDPLNIFRYNCTSTFTESALKHNCVLWHYPAVAGCLFFMNRWMWSRLPWSGEFQLDVSKLRPRAYAQPVAGDSNQKTFILQILPQYGYDGEIRADQPGTMTDQLRSLRTHLRSTGAAVRFVYSNRTRGRSEWGRIDQMDPSDETRLETDEMPAVLFPRHFIMTQEALPFPELCAAAEQTKEGVFRRDFIADGVLLSFPL